MISRNTLISVLVLLAGLLAGYFIFQLTRALPVFNLNTEKPEFWSDTKPRSSSSLPFQGSSLELSHMYSSSAENFQDLLDAGVLDLKRISAKRELLLSHRDTLTDTDESLDRQIRELEYGMDLHRLMDYYTRYFMHYYRWIELGEQSASVAYKLAMGQFWATVEFHQSKYAEKPLPDGIDLNALMGGTELTRQTDRAVRWAKVIVVILLFLLVMGIPRFIRDRGYRKFAASLYFDSIFRPNKVSDMNSWHSLSRLALVLILLYLLGAVVLSSFSSWLLTLVLASLGLIPVIFLLIMAKNKRRSSAILISLLAPELLILLAVLGVMALRGPMFFWYHIWISDLFRAIFLAIFTMLVFHKYRVHIMLARKWSHRNRRGSAAMVVMAAGLQSMAIGFLLLGLGRKSVLQVLNSEIYLLPEYGPEAQGFLKWLGLGPAFPKWLLICSVIILIISFLVFLFNRKVQTSASHSTQA